MMDDIPDRLRELQLHQIRRRRRLMLGGALLYLADQERRRGRQRRFWIRPWICRRVELGGYHQLVAELMREAHGDFKGFFRMEPELFHDMLTRLAPGLTKEHTRLREPLEPGLKVAITLRYLACGNSYRSLGFTFRVPHNTISKFVPVVCQAIVDEYEGEVFPVPGTPAEWRLVADKFAQRWNFHHCCGAIDGKHVAIKAPSHSGTVYHNYKSYFSIIMLCVVDADYKFLWADVGANGSTSDCAVYNRSDLSTALEEDGMGFPDPEPLPADDIDVPYFLVGDDAFPLRTWMMKPFSNRNLDDEERIFNYRLSRARRISENAFGILANRFRCLLTTLGQEVDTCKLVVKACLCLHNLLRVHYPHFGPGEVDREDQNHRVIPGAWRGQHVLDEMDTVAGGNRANREGKRQRVLLKHYYNTVGAVPWQQERL